MRKSSVISLIITLIFASLSWAASPRPEAGYVPDKVTALKVAEAILVTYIGEKRFNAQKPFNADLKHGVWTVWGSFYPSDGSSGEHWRGGGAAEIKINKDDGKILDVSFAR